MTRFRTLLCWLLCALLVGARVPEQRRACETDADGNPLAVTARDAAPPPSCCTPTQTCCCPAAMHACDCASPERQPLPEPQPQSPKQLGLAATAPVRAPPSSTKAPAAAASPATRARAGIRTAILPHCSRQEALSVWRC